MMPHHPSSPAGFLLVDKPAGMTSHDVVAGVRRWAHTRRVGHAGTLDPAATGLLLLGVGRATRLLGHLALAGKHYRATFVVGQATSTDDAQGEVIEELPPPQLPGGVQDSRLLQAVESLTGPIDQIPPQVSAVKVAGVRAYARARAGQSVQLAPRRVTIEQFLVEQMWTTPQGMVHLQVSVRCSSGTYIRSMARDLGLALGSVGHVASLRRTQVGPFGVEQAMTWEQIAGPQPEPSSRALLPLSQVVQACLPTLTVDETQRQILSHGGALALERLRAGPQLPEQAVVALLDSQQEVVALGKVCEGLVKPRTVLVEASAEPPRDPSPGPNV